MSHAAREVAIGRTDAANRRVESAEGVAGAAETCGTGGVADLGARGQEDLFESLAVDEFSLQAAGDLGGGGDDEGVDLDASAAEDAGGGAEVGHLAAGAGADVRAVKLRALHF